MAWRCDWSIVWPHLGAIELPGRLSDFVLPNSLAFLIAHHAAMRDGGAPALLNTALPNKSLFRLVADFGPSLVLSYEPGDGVQAEILTDPDLFTLASSIGTKPTLDRCRATSEDIAAILLPEAQQVFQNEYRTAIAR